jgi:type IV pilus assembly protein PilC
MLSSGIPVTRALYTLAEQRAHPTLSKALSSISVEVESGMSLTDAFKAYPKIFPPLYISMIEVGEIGGMLEESLIRLANQLEKEKALKDAIKSAMFYPKIVFGFALIIVIAMMSFMVSMFQGFIPASAEIPGITQVIFNASGFWRSKWYLVIAFIIATIVAFKVLKQKEQVKRILEKIKLKIPGFGPLIEKSNIARFCRTLSTLMAGGIPVVQAMLSSGPTSGSYIGEEAVKRAATRVEEGGRIATELKNTEIFPPMVVHMTEVGEESGQLPELLDRIAGFYEEEVATLTKGLTAIIEPLMLIGVGLVVGGMLISLYLPIFTVVTAQ